MRFLRGSICLAAASAVVAGCSAQPDDGASPGPETVTVTYSSSTSNAPTTQTVTSSPSSTSGRRTTSSSAGGSPSGSSASPSASPSSSPSASPSSSSGPSSDDPTNDAPGAQLPSSAGEYADAFVRAWGKGDRTDASTYGTGAAVSALFGQAGNGGGGWQRTGTTEYAGSTQVTYSDGSRTLTLVVDHTALGAGDEHAVTSAVLSSGEPTTAPTDAGDGLPQTVSAYADAFVRAWGKSDSGAWDYANDQVRSILGSGAGPNPGAWSRSSTDGSSVSYRNRDGSLLVLQLDGDRVADGSRDAITGATRS
ncbi:hypothetical protein [Janibacter anophelis]|uniref:hypothetical protein n=1 Tax=Janibacter anophelis TaxID=319054 RepID=UPI0012ED9AB4|nr:hypothetical protein [Janibacter anophelis]